MAFSESVLAAQAASLALNLVSGIGVVLANKLAFTYAHFAFPTALTAIHYATNYAVLLCIAAVSPPKANHQSSSSLDRELIATTAVWALHNALSNLSLSRNSVGLYQISKILVTPLIVALEFAVYGRLPQRRLAIPLIGACAGVALATVSDVSFEARGAATAAASACVSAVLKVLQEWLLQRRGWSSLELMRRTWGPQTLLLLLCTPLLDARFDEMMEYRLTMERASILLLSAAAGFALNVSSLMAIKLTSAIAIVLLSQGKTVATILGGYLFFDAHPNARQVFGAAMAVVSLSAYSYSSAVLAQQKNSSTLDVARELRQPGDPDDQDCDQQLEQQPLRGTGRAPTDRM